MSSWACLRYRSRPLHNGQTRISSSFGSTPLIEFPQQPRAERRIELGAHRQHPPVGPRDAAQFYRVLLGEHHRRRVAELEIRWAEAMMVWKRMRHHLDARLAQMNEKTVRIADARNRVHLLAGERL